MGTRGATEEMGNVIDGLRERLQRVREHRLVFFGIYDERDDILSQMKRELGNVEIISWKLEHDRIFWAYAVYGDRLLRRVKVFLVQYREREK